MSVHRVHLDMKICDFYNNVYGIDNTETFREFVQNTEKEFGLKSKNFDELSNKQLNDYLDFLDSLWGK